MDEYLKTLLEQIRCKKARPYVKQEFQDHIEDQIEANKHAGMDRTGREGSCPGYGRSCGNRNLS